MHATRLPHVQNKLATLAYHTLCVLLFFTYILPMRRTELTMTSIASNLNAGLDRLVWKEGENSTPTDFCAPVSSTPQRERKSRFHYWGCNQLSMTTCEWYKCFSHITDCQMGSDFGPLQFLSYFIWGFILNF
jgi:hypothetical protein